ncbi:hypothetical protein V8E36_006427 [Tilletia maclaganii]
MDFTDCHPHQSSSSIIFSPGSTFLAYVAGSRANTVIVCRSDTLQVANQWTFDDYDIQQLQWSDDGLFLHATNLLHGIIFVLSPDPQRRPTDASDDGQGWLARLEAGYEGLAAAAWTPSAGPPTILAFSMHQLRMTAYDLANESVTVFESPKKPRVLRSIKLPGTFAILETSNEVDQLSIYRYKPHSGLRPTKDEPSGWLVDHSFPIATNDATDVVWSPDGNHLAISESVLEYKVLVYTSSGSLRVTLSSEGFQNPQIAVTHPPSVETAQGSRTTAIKKRVAKGKAKESVDEIAVASGGLGVRCTVWHPSGQMLAVGGYDEQIRILESEFWGLWSTIDLSPHLISQGDSPQVHAFREPSAWLTDVEGQGIVDYQPASLPLTPPSTRPDLSKPNPKLGVSWMEFNEDGTMLACRNDAMPTSLFVYHLPRATAGSLIDTAKTRPQPRLIAVLIQTAPIKASVWRPRHYASLYLCCGGPAIFSWRAVLSEEGGASDQLAKTSSQIQQRAECIAVPSDENFTANDVKWSPDGRKLLVIDNDLFCCAIDVDSQQ